MIYFTSDTHFCHIKEFLFTPRGFTNVEDMNSAIIEKWNRTIGPNDEVYHLGDFVMNDIDAGIELIKQLNGKIHLIRGNHDTDKKVERYLELPNVVSVQYADVLKYGKAVFWMGHYPTITANYDDDKPWAKHVVCLFGHTHQEQSFYNDNPYMYNVGMDAHNCTPITIDEIIADIRKKKEELNNEQMENRTCGIK